MKTRRAKQGKQLARGHSCGVVETGDRSQQLGSGALHLTQGRNCCSELNGRVRITVSLFFCGDLSACKCPEKLHFAVGASVSVHSWGGGGAGDVEAHVVLHFYHIYIFRVTVSNQIISPILQIRQIIREDICFAWGHKTTRNS